MGGSGFGAVGAGVGAGVVSGTVQVSGFRISGKRWFGISGELQTA